MKLTITLTQADRIISAMEFFRDHAPGLERSWIDRLNSEVKQLKPRVERLRMKTRLRDAKVQMEEKMGTPRARALARLKLQKVREGRP